MEILSMSGKERKRMVVATKLRMDHRQLDVSEKDGSKKTINYRH
jgi:hypothetical protein